MTEPSDSTSAPEIHELSGSTPPGAGGPPVFKPTSPPRPRPQIRPRNEQQTAERAVVDLSGRLAKLLRRHSVLVHELEVLELHSLLADKQAQLVRILERVARRIDLWARQLAALKSPTAQAAAAKADALIEMAVLGFKCCEEFDGLALSLAHDQVALGPEAASMPQVSLGNFGRYHTEILQVHADLKASDGSDAAAAALMDRWAIIDSMAMADQPRDLADALGALLYARREHHQFAIEPRQDTGTDPDKGDALILHLLDGATAVLQRVVQTEAAAAPLAQGHICTTEEAAEISFEAWTGECLVPSNADWPEIGADHLPSARLAWLVNTKTKEELMSTLAAIDEEDETLVQKLWEDLKDTASFFKAFFDLVDIAELRVIVALSTMLTDPRYGDRFKDTDLGADVRAA